MNREPGWYWVKWIKTSAWECAMWTDSVGWLTAGTEASIYDMEIIGPKIEEPKESGK